MVERDAIRDRPRAEKLALATKQQGEIEAFRAGEPAVPVRPAREAQVVAVEVPPAGPTLAGPTVPPAGPTVPPATSILPQPPPIKPTKLGENVIGLRTIEPGLVRSEVVGNWVKRMLNYPLKKIGVKPAFIEADPMANAALNERARVRVAIESNANVVGTEAEARISKAFKLNKQGRVNSLAGIDPEVPGSPTIQDIAARLPNYKASLTAEQLAALKATKEALEPYGALLKEVGVDVAQRPDVIEGGFYLPRGRAALEGVDEPVKVSGGRRGGAKKGFERPALFSSQAEGINSGYEYAPIGETLTSYAFDAGSRATDAHVANYFKALTDDTGRLLGETPKMRMLRQNPQIAKAVEALNANLTKLKNNIGALTKRQMDVIDLWQKDPDMGDIDTLLDGLETMRGGKPPVTLPELQALKAQTIEEIKALRPEYKLAMRRAQVSPRDQGVIILPALQGVTFPNEIANAANTILKSEGPTVGALAPAVNLANALNNLYRGLRATLDNSALGIQGLLGLYGQPKAYAEALKVNIKAWGRGGDKVMGKFLTEFDDIATRNGRLNSSGWSKSGLHLGGATSEFQLGGGQGIGEKIADLPGVRQANRAFGFTGDSLRLTWADNELVRLLRERSLDEIQISGDLDRIANVANVMTGWAKGKTFASVGDLVLFAPRFFQSRLETVAKAAMGLRPGATIDQEIARNALLKMIGFGTMVTVGANMAQGQDTDFRPIVDGKRNPKFMRVKFGSNYYSLFGTWDSLMGIFVNTATGKPLAAFRSVSSGVVSGAWDIITGKDYNRNPVRDTPEHFAKWILGNLVPFGVGQLPQGIGQIAEGELVAGGVQIASQLVGIKSYPEEDWGTNQRRLGLPLSPDPALYSTENPIYNTKLFYNDTLAKLGKINLDEVVGNKDYPASVQSIAGTKKLLPTFHALPNQKPTEINADLSKGDTYEQFFQQWQERQKLLNDPEKLKEFDKRNPNAEKGNMTQRQYVLLEQYHNIKEKKRQAQFLKENPELGINLRTEWLKSHPKENAQLAIWGQAKLLTQAAYDEAKKLIKELDIPDNALPDLTLPPELSVKGYVQYQEAVDKFSANSAEVKLLLAKDEELRKFLGREVVDTPVELLELNVQYRKQDEEYDALPTTGADRANYLAQNEDYRKDRRRREAYQKGLTDQVENYVAYYELPIKGYRQERFLIDNPDFAQAAGLKIPGKAPPSEQYDILLEKADKTPEDFVRMEAYKLFVPDKHIENYVAYKAVEGTSGYEDDWWMMEHPDFYKEVYLGILGKPRKDYRKVPTRQVFALYQRYQGLPLGKARAEFRARHPDLEAWGRLAGLWQAPVPTPTPKPTPKPTPTPIPTRRSMPTLEPIKR